MILALAVVLLAAPAWAVVTITLTDLGNNEIAIGYDATSEAELVRAFALDVNVAGGTIVDINDYAVGDDNHGYGIFPGNFSLYITVQANGTVTNWDDPNYTPVAPSDDPGALGGLGTDGITIEMGSLYDANAPAKSGVLCTVTISEGTKKLCVTGNAIRGNIVMEDAGEVIPVEACLLFDCFPSTFTTYADWVTYGKPKCWCNKLVDPAATGDYQCDGDGDGATQGIAKYRIYTNDLNLLIPNWQKKITDPTINPCADYDHKGQGIAKYRVYTNDLQKLIDNWQKKDAALPGNCGLAVATGGKPARPE
jgi:hypothetical protein